MKFSVLVNKVLAARTYSIRDTAVVAHALGQDNSGAQVRIITRKQALQVVGSKSIDEIHTILVVWTAQVEEELAI